jgi:hypothetical protein
VGGDDMRLELISLTQYKTDDDPIELDDYSSNSLAVYKASNPDKKTFVYFEPDEYRLPEPRCDYVLTCKNDPYFAARFIELKGDDLHRTVKKYQCCKTEWEHAFHQLFSTFKSLELYMDLPNEMYKFILCTSRNIKPTTRYRTYQWYRDINENLNAEIIILYRDEFDLL